MVATLSQNKDPEVIPAPELRGAARELGRCRDLECCIEGPAGTGKTYAALYKVHMMLLHYPGAKALVARKSNTDLAGSAMATFRDAILDPREGVRYFGGNRIRPAAFEYPNGSIMVVNGLDKPSKVKSWEFDLAYINEATECTLEDAEFVRSRLRASKIGYNQLILDCNPDAPTHWLNQRMIEGKTTRLMSRHQDNPAYFDAETQEWTEEGHRYIYETLEGLTGIRKARLLYGLWAAASGTVYEDSWDRTRNVIDRGPVPREWPRYLAIDFGFTHPFVCLWAAIDGDGRIIIYRQIYKTKTLVEDHATAIAFASGWYHLLPKDHPKYASKPADWADPLPRDIVCDHDAEDRATLERHLKLYTTPARKTVSDGIQAVASRFRAAGDGRPRIMIMKNAMVERDKELLKAKKPTCLEDEPENYVWRQTSSGMKEEPAKEYDDALDALRYLVAHFDVQPMGISYYKNIWG